MNGDPDIFVGRASLAIGALFLLASAMGWL